MFIGLKSTTLFQKLHPHKTIRNARLEIWFELFLTTPICTALCEKYLKESCSSEPHLQLSFKYFSNSCSIPKLFIEICRSRQPYQLEWAHRLTYSDWVWCPSVSRRCCGRCVPPPRTRPRPHAGYHARGRCHLTWNSSPRVPSPRS